MAQYKLFSVLVHTPPSSSDLVANDVVDMFWDDSTLAIVVKKNSVVWTGSAGGYFGDLDTNYYISGATSYEGQYAISGYSFCDSTALKWFRMVTSYATYPYAEQVTTTDSPVCAAGGGAVCDIIFVGAPTIVHSTNKSTGGSITFQVSSSNGTIKYNLSNFEYASGGTVASAGDNTISGLIPGPWTLYAKDANDCTAILNFTILYKPTENEHYRFTWDPVTIGQGNVRESRVRIYEREYPGDVVEVNAGAASPFKHFKPSQGNMDDKLFPIHPTNATLHFISERDYQFLPLYTEDDKKYRVVYEVNEAGAGYTEAWQGFILPSPYLEDFRAVPYVTEIPITDNVKTLERIDFTDDDGNLMNGSVKLIKVISHVMKRTGLNLKIRSGINIFETNHNTAATDDPLDQTYIDVACYRKDGKPFKCWAVLEAILKPFGARIYQADNQWWIEEIDRATAPYAYRVFTSAGVYESNGTYDPIIDIKAYDLTDRAVLTERDHTMEVIPAYGKITVTNELNYVGSLIAGSFEKQDLLSPESEQQSANPGIFTSEEGFKDWTLRYNGTDGVSFGRSVVLSDDNTLSLLRLMDTEKATREDIARSVGTFYFTPGAWSGNLRDAYIESSAKPYQYGPGDELKFSFEYSTPSTVGDIPFMILRMAIKVGTKWLQPDGISWSTTEAIYRAYPAPSTKLQKFELFVTLPEVTVITDTTIQVRVYYYAKDFYDFGLPAHENDRTSGTEGLTDLSNFPAASIDYDYKLDVRVHKTTGSVTNVSRSFVELRISQAATNIDEGILRAGDYHDTDNPKIWVADSAVLENKKFLSFADFKAVRDTLFYIDNVNVDALINGQDPPREETIELNISKQVNETLGVTLYNADRPTVVNAKNMYNNHFRLSDGTPTTIWQRSGVAEFLPLNYILLKVLAGNHSAPTFRLTGSFLNEFQRIGINNYLRLTKTGSNLSMSNTTFTSDLTGWDQTGSGGTFTWTADNSGSAEVTLSGAQDSKKISQAITHSGGYIQITAGVGIVPVSASNDREDIFWAVFFRDSSIVHAEKLHTFVLSSVASYTISHTAFVPGQITAIGFFFQRVTGTADITYQVTEFTPAGTDIQEVYQIADYQFDEKFNTYFLELRQISKTYVSLGAIDSGGTNQGGGSNGGDYNSDYSNDFDGGFN